METYLYQIGVEGFWVLLAIFDIALFGLILANAFDY